MIFIFSRKKRTRVLSIEDIDKEQNKLLKKLSNIKKGKKPIEKKHFLGNIIFFCKPLETYKIKLDKSKILCIEKKKLFKKYITI